MMLVGLRVSAQDIDSARARFLIALPADAQVYRFNTQISPCSSSGTPTASGAEWSDLFSGAGYQASTIYTPHHDGDAYAGLGLGNSPDYNRSERAYTSVSTLRTGFLRQGRFSFKGHRDLRWN